MVGSKGHGFRDYVRCRLHNKSRHRSRSVLAQGRSRNKTRMRPLSSSRTAKQYAYKVRSPVTKTPSPLPSGALRVNGSATSEASTLANVLIQPIKTIQPVTSQHYYISHFDPSKDGVRKWIASETPTGGAIRNDCRESVPIQSLTKRVGYQ